MEFLYPPPILNSHIILETVANSLEYPKDSSYDKNFSFDKLENVPVCIIRENVGYKNEWAEVLVVDYAYSEYGYFKNKFYIKQIGLNNIGNKTKYKPLKDIQFNIDVNSEEIDPTLKEAFIPYVDRQNGLYSVRILTDYDKVQESFVFAKLLEEVYMEGVKILLSSRGLRSDNGTINELRNKYYTFAYVNKDLDLTIARPCESLTFTVSIPLNLFDTEAPDIKKSSSNNVNPDVVPDITIKFSNKDLNSKIGLIANAFANRANDIIRLLYPNRFIQGFVLDFELASLKTFYSSGAELFETIGFPFSSTGFTSYEIGLNTDREIIKITIEKDSKQYILPVNILSQFRMNGEFNSKRIFYYLETYETMITESINSEITDFIFRYVKYPKPNIVHDETVINGKPVPQEKADRYRVFFDESAESCLRLSDITGLVSNLSDFTDVSYNLFVVKKDEDGKEIPSAIDKLQANFKNLKSEINSARTDAKDSAGIVQEAPAGMSMKDFQQGFSQAATTYSEKFTDFRTSIATLAYYSQRININKILFSKILCYLKRLDPNDPNNPEVARILSEIPGDLINYANTLSGVNRLSPKDFARAIANGTNFDISLFCGKNMEAVYFLRGMTKLVKTLNVAGTQAIAFANTLADKQNNPNPWIGFANTMIKSFESAMLNFIFGYLKSILMENCENDPTDNNGNDYRNPFDSHTPVEKFGGLKENNNTEIIKANRAKILDTVFPPDGQYRKLVYGTDRTYEVNLIGQLLTDINCVLTPQESVSLLLGKPSPQVEILIKNLVNKKYSTPPNDLKYITRDVNYMKMFFKKLGLTVDEEFKTIRVPGIDNNTLSLSTLCKTTDPDEPIFRKVPIELGTLEDRNIKLAKRAREMLEMIKDGKTVSATAICSDEPDSSLSEAKENLLTTYREGIISEFNPVVIAFSDESAKLPDVYSEEKNFYRRDSDGKLIDTIDYHSYNDNIARNLEDCKVENNKIYCLPKYMAPQGTEEIARQQLNLQQSEVKIICPDSKFELNSDFEKVLNNKQIVLEFAQDFLFDAEDGDLGDLYTESRKVSRYLKDKKVTYTISLNKDALQDIVTLGIASDADLIEFKIIYNDSTNNKFRILNQVGFQKDVGEIVGNKKYSSDKFYDNLSKNVDIEGRNELDDGDDVYFLDKETFLKLGIEEKNLIQAIWTDKFSKDLNRIKTYEEQIALINQFNKIGIFNIEKKGTDASINVASFDIGSEENTKSIIEKSYLEYYSGNFNLGDVKKYFNILYGILKDKKYAKYGFDKLADLRYFDNSGGFLGFGAGNGEEVVPESLTDANDYIEDGDYVIKENIENDFYLKQVSKFSLLNYVQTPAQAACNITPHYLNLEYFLNLSLDIGRKELCDDTVEMIPVNITDDILVNLITRAHVADLLVKSLPMLAIQNINFLENLYKQDIFVEILSKFMKNEMSLYTAGSQKDNAYYRLFVERAEKVYIKHKQDNNLNKNVMDVSKTSLEYYIRREVRYFIKSCLEKGIFTSNRGSYDDTFIKNGIDGKENLNNLYYTAIVYFLANNTIDYTKRVQFTRTLKGLSTIFFSNSNESSLTPDEADAFKNSNKSQEDVIKFISNLGYSSNPAMMAMIKPEYAKYLKYFLEESIKQARSTILTIAQNGDPNISLTRKINFGLTTAAAISWVLLDEDQRNQLIYKSTSEPEAIIWKRIDSGKSPIPDAGISLGLMTAQIFPGAYGFAYLGIDSLLEYKWYDTAIAEIRAAKKLKATDDPCAPAKVDQNNQNVDIKCTIDKKAALLDELNSTEVSNKE